MPKSFPPILGRNPKILILGSMPSLVSLEKNQYYAHPRNQFWGLLGAVLGEDLPAMPFSSRAAALKRRGIALWDVLAECARKGSLDADIRDEKPNPVAEFLRDTGIKIVFLNGGAAGSAFEMFIAESLPETITVHKLPSSSPANTAGFKQKLARWSKIGEFLPGCHATF